MAICNYCGQPIPAEKPCWACRTPPEHERTWLSPEEDARLTFHETVRAAVDLARLENVQCDSVFVSPSFARPHCPDRAKLDGVTIVYDVNCPHGEAYPAGIDHSHTKLETPPWIDNTPADRIEQVRMLLEYELIDRDAALMLLDRPFGD